MTSVSMSGAGLSAQLMQAMDQLGRELRQDHRDAARHEADRALSEGLREAESMQQQADATLDGAFVHGALTVASGSIQAGAAASMKVEAPDAPPDAAAGHFRPDEALPSSPGAACADAPRAAPSFDAIAAHNQRAQGILTASGTLGQLGGVARDVGEARSTHHGAEAKIHAAQAQAASRRAEAEQADAQEASRMSDKARDLHQQIASLEHTSRMAVLRG